MDEPQVQQFVDIWVAAWNAHDLDAVLARFDDQVEFTSPIAARLIPANLDVIEPDRFPITSAISLAELAAGVQAADDVAERAIRQQRIQQAESAFAPLPFGAACAGHYGLFYAADRSAGRQPQRRLADLLIAAIGVDYQIPLFTRNPDDFAGLIASASIHTV